MSHAFLCYFCSIPTQTLATYTLKLQTTLVLPSPHDLLTSPHPSSPLPPKPALFFSEGTEWTCTKRRMLAGITTDYAFGLGYMLLAGIAYLIRDWRKLQLAISAPGFLLIFYIWWEI